MNRINQTTALLTALLLACPVALQAAERTDGPAALAPRPEDYTLLWWADGPPHFFGSTTSPVSETLCFQSGLWGLALDTKRVRVLRAGEWPKPLALAKAVLPGRAALDELPAADWDCAVVVDGRRFTCVGRMETGDEFTQPVRFVESGRFFQRVVIEGLRFADGSGTELACNARLEISAWPDRLSVRLELEPKEPAAAGFAELRLGDRRAAAPLAERTSVRIEAFGRSGARRATVDADPALKVGFDESLGCHTLALPEKPWSNAGGTYYPEEHLDRLDRWRVTLRNDSDQPSVVRLMFTQQHHLPITGFTPMLCDADGTPSGLPVQNSKNWHRRPEKGQLTHEGPWFHGFAFVRLPPGVEREFRFQMVHARYGGVFAASHAQLCLVGWGHNQFWDQAAIGSFGESICFEPGRVQRRCFIDDVRPLMSLPHGKPAKPWGWADNCGGGDFLMWLDEQGRYRPMRATRTDYRAYGPCLTHAVYTEESPGGELSARMEVSLPRSDDHLRTFLHLRYDVLRPLRFQRLAFFQLGSDFYNDTPSRRVAVGDANGLGEEWEPKRARDVFDRRGVPLAGSQPWLSLHGLDRAALSSGHAAAGRGVIVRAWRAVLGGKQLPLPHASFFCTERGQGNHRIVAELAPPPGATELRRGDFVEADLELVVFPADAAAYYGPDRDFSEALARDADTWRLVHREASGNALTARAHRGSLVKPYPLVVRVDGRQRAEVSLQGGLGYVPVTFTGLSQPRGHRLMVDDKPVDQSVHQNDFWQTDHDANTRSWQITFNVPLGGPKPHTLQLMQTP